MVQTMQAISGAGYPGVSSLNIIDNVVPYIADEEEKMESELLKILSTWTSKTWNEPESLSISASCNRVNVIDGHTLNVSVEFETTEKPSLDDIFNTFG